MPTNHKKTGAEPTSEMSYKSHKNQRMDNGQRPIQYSYNISSSFPHYCHWK